MGYPNDQGNPAGAIPVYFGNSVRSIATNQVSVLATATLIAAARAGRSMITIVNGGTTDVFVGGSGVTAGTGVLLVGIKGASITIPTSGAVYGITGGGSQAVSFLEAY